jgi:hypothetical protein
VDCEQDHPECDHNRDQCRDQEPMDLPPEAVPSQGFWKGTHKRLTVARSHPASIDGFGAERSSGKLALLHCWEEVETHDRTSSLVGGCDTKPMGLRAAHLGPSAQGAESNSRSTGTAVLTRAGRWHHARAVRPCLPAVRPLAIMGDWPSCNRLWARAERWVSSAAPCLARISTQLVRRKVQASS